MKLVQVNWNPSRRQLQQFGVAAVMALPALGWLWGASQWGMTSLFGTGIALAAMGFLCPALLKPVFVGLSLVTIPLGLVVSEIILGLVFLGIFLPIGLIFRLIHRDSLQLTRVPNADTYWQRKPQPRSVASYYRQW